MRSKLVRLVAFCTKSMLRKPPGVPTTSVAASLNTLPDRRVLPINSMLSLELAAEASGPSFTVKVPE